MTVHHWIDEAGPMTAPILGGFTQSQISDLLARTCAIADLDAGGAVLVRGQTNAVIRLAAHPVIVKIARKGTDPELVRTTVSFVRWLMDLGFPTVPLHRPELQPLLADGHPVTLWTYLPQPGHPVPAASIAKPLSMLHSLGRPPLELRDTDTCAAIRGSLTRTKSLPHDALRSLWKRLDELEHALASLTYELPPSVIQGDPQHGNALFDGGRTVLCDWDNVTVGQPEWDLVTIEVHCRRFGYGRRHYEQFAEAYGRDVTRWSGYPVLRDLRELRMIATNARKATYEPAKAAEILRRIHGFNAGQLQRRWNIL
jgi:hypothetical protein